MLSLIESSWNNFQIKSTVDLLADRSQSVNYQKLTKTNNFADNCLTQIWQSKIDKNFLRPTSIRRNNTHAFDQLTWLMSTQHKQKVHPPQFMNAESFQKQTKNSLLSQPRFWLMCWTQGKTKKLNSSKMCIHFTITYVKTLTLGFFMTFFSQRNIQV